MNILKSIFQKRQTPQGLRITNPKERRLAMRMMRKEIEALETKLKALSLVEQKQKKAQPVARQNIIKEINKIKFVLFGVQRNRLGSRFWDFIPIPRTTKRLSRLNRY